MNKKIYLDDGIELIILNEIEYSGKTYLLTDEIKNEEPQGKFEIYEKIKEENGFSIEPVQNSNLKSELATLLNKI